MLLPKSYRQAGLLARQKVLFKRLYCSKRNCPIEQYAMHLIQHLFHSKLNFTCDRSSNFIIDGEQVVDQMPSEFHSAWPFNVVIPPPPVGDTTPPFTEDAGIASLASEISQTPLESMPFKLRSVGTVDDDEITLSPAADTRPPIKEVADITSLAPTEPRTSPEPTLSELYPAGPVYDQGDPPTLIDETQQPIAEDVEIASLAVPQTPPTPAPSELHSVWPVGDEGVPIAPIDEAQKAVTEDVDIASVAPEMLQAPLESTPSELQSVRPVDDEEVLPAPSLETGSPIADNKVSTSLSTPQTPGETSSEWHMEEVLAGSTAIDTEAPIPNDPVDINATTSAPQTTLEQQISELHSATQFEMKKSRLFQSSVPNYPSLTV